MGLITIMDKWSSVDIQSALASTMSTLKNDGLNVAYICVYGSQNYELDIHTVDYQSDLDMKAVVIPTLRDLINNSKPISEVRDTPWGQVDIKDIRSFITNVKKANPSYIECLFTNHYQIAPGSYSSGIQNMRDHAQELCVAQSAQMAKGLYGMIKEKQKAMCHPYPSIKHKIDEFGYCGKQLSHAYRLGLMLDMWVNDTPMRKMLVPNEKEKELILDYKLNKPTLAEANIIMQDIVDHAKYLLDDYLLYIHDIPLIKLNPNDILRKYDEFKSDIIEYGIKRQLKEEM